jgi:hypothetical protein
MASHSMATTRETYCRFNLKRDREQAIVISGHTVTRSPSPVSTRLKRLLRAALRSSALVHKGCKRRNAQYGQFNSKNRARDRVT